MRQQRGGTLLGFILGLLIGLGGALAVAVYVTKVPIPIVDRGLQRKSEQDSQEKERNKDWNPNAAVAGKAVPSLRPEEPTAPSSSGTPPAPGAASPPGAGPVTPPKPAEPVKPPPNAKDPLGELIQSQSPKTPAEAADPYVYFVQAGVFRTPEAAETQRAKLAMQGWDFKVSEREQAGQLVYRLRLGPYRQKAEAEQIHENLSSKGLEAALVRSQR